MVIDKILKRNISCKKGGARGILVLFLSRMFFTGIFVKKL